MAENNKSELKIEIHVRENSMTDNETFEYNGQEYAFKDLTDEMIEDLIDDLESDILELEDEIDSLETKKEDLEDLREQLEDMQDARG